MNIQHRPLFNPNQVEQHYTEKDGVEVKYVCTSAIDEGTRCMDIFYRETPHPEFGNRYFGLYHGGNYLENHIDTIVGKAKPMITNADAIENVQFEMVEVNGALHYSRHRHDFHSVGDVSIDGGRAYLRRVGNLNNPVRKFVVRDGEFVEK
jgi:hypothetical protein